MNFEQKITSYIQSQISSDAPIIVAVSGGIDSIVLSYLVRKVNSKAIIAHFDHNVRTDSSDDAKFVENLAKEWKMSFKLGVWEEAKPDASEDDMRRARYEFLENLRMEEGAKYILSAHHADDQLETILMNLIRGSGISGLRGMKPFNFNIFRPLLDVSKTEIIAYAKGNNLSFREDPSNKDVGYRRNFIRHKIVPLCKQLNPNILQVSGNTAKRLLDIENYIIDEIKAWVEEHVQDNRFNREKFRNLPEFFQTFVIKELIESETSFTYEFTQEFLDILNTKETGKKAIIKGWVFELERDNIRYYNKNHSLSS